MILSSHSDGVYAPAKEQLKEIVDYFKCKIAGVLTSHLEEYRTDKKLAEVADLGQNFNQITKVNKLIFTQNSRAILWTQ